MPRTLIYFLLFILVLASTSRAAEIIRPDVRLNDNVIHVNTGLKLNAAQITEIEKGISKRVIIYVDLFRVWKGWPDEFVLGKTITRTIHCDPVKKEYLATSLYGSTMTEKRFRDCGSLLGWALMAQSVDLTSTIELEPADYFVKVMAEGRVRDLPPFINLLFFFVKEREFSVVGASDIFSVNKGDR